MKLYMQVLRLRNRRAFIKKTIIPALFILLTISVAAQTTKEILYVGTYSVRGSVGIYVYEFIRSNGDFKLIQSVKTLENPTFLTIHPSGKFIYAVNREAAPGFSKLGSVSAFAVDPSTGKLSLLNQQSSYGVGPCHITTDQTGKLAFVSNYGEGNLVVLPIADDGSLKALSDSICFSGRGPHNERQDKPHIHSATVSPDNRFLQVADLGTDKVYCFAIDIANKKLSPATKPFINVKPGSGPRHFTYTPEGKYAYLAEELSSTVAAFSYDKKSGALELIEDQIVSLPVDFKETNTSADIHTDVSGKYLMISNRGHNSITLYNIEKNGKLTLQGVVKTKGEKPRNFLVDSKNEFVFVANQDSDNIVVFKWDTKTGKLTDTGAAIKIPSPVCLKMLTLN